MILERTRSLLGTIGSRSEEIERARRLPMDLARTLAAADLFRLFVPRALGGLEADPATALEVIETLAQVDASVGWCVMIGATSGLVGGYLPLDSARVIFDSPLTILGGVFAPMGKAVPEGASFRVSGQWQWASGSANCHWLMGGCAVLDEGRPRMLEGGMLDARMMIFPGEAAELIDTWHVSGLCGTGSGTMKLQERLVDRDYSVSLIVDPPRESGPLYRFPAFGLLALGIAAVMLGNARAAVSDLVDLAGGKRAPGSQRTLAERAQAQADLARTEASLRAARAFMQDAVGQAWRSACAGDTLSIETRAALRLAATHATRTSAEATRAMYDLGGGSSVFLSSPLQRRFRDGHTGTQHMMVAPPTYELVGRLLMGLPTDVRQV